MLPMVLKEPGKAFFKATMSWATAVAGDVIITSVLMGLRADFGFMVGGLVRVVWCWTGRVLCGVHY